MLHYLLLAALAGLSVTTGTGAVLNMSDIKHFRSSQFKLYFKVNQVQIKRSPEITQIFKKQQSTGVLLSDGMLLVIFVLSSKYLLAVTSL